MAKQFYNWLKSLRFGRSSIDTRYAIAEACLIGVLSALAALLLKEGVGWLGGWRLWFAEKFGAWWVLPAAGLIFGGLAGWLVEEFAPAAGGGGIPQVKAALARYPIPLSLRVALVKLLGSILVLGGGMTLGRRAPTVHIGAALAAQLSQWLPTSPEHRRQTIAAGAAAGLAAGFTTPIAGVLFVVEELMRDASGLTLETAIVASFTGAVVSLLLQSANLNFPHSLINLPDIQFSAPEIPWFLLLGILAGLLGGLFNRWMLLFADINRRLNWPLAGRIGLAGLISGIAVALLPPFFRDNSGLREFVILGELSWQQTAFAFIAQFCLTILAYSASAPGGLFAPALVMGSALGYLVGDLTNLALNTGTQATYALAGMGAFFTAVVRVPVTAIVIVFELTANFNVVLPLMLTCAVAYLVADAVSPGSLYQHLLEATGIFLNDEGNQGRDLLAELTAADVMQSQVETLASHLTLEQVLQSMSRSHHRGFPVVEGGKIVGIVTQTDLAKLSQRPGKLPLKDFMTTQPIAVKTTTSLSDVLYLLNRYQLSRLPVTEEQKLVGIITRSDIIRVEADQLAGKGTQGAQATPSYVIYQTRSPAIGQGRILLPLANPETAAELFQIAAGIARQQNYEIDCLHIIKVPKHSLPERVAVDARQGRKLLHRVERLGRRSHLSVHSEIRVAQDIASAILEAVRQRHINLLVMGWQGETRSAGAIFGSAVDLLIRQVPCDLMLVKLGSSALAYPRSLQRPATWLLPMAGGPNARRAIAFLPGLASLYQKPDSPQFLLCQVFLPTMSKSDYRALDRAAQSLSQNLRQPVLPVPLCAPSVADAIIDVARAQHCDAVVLGATREGLLHHAIHGNIPETILRGVEGTVILVRGAID